MKKLSEQLLLRTDDDDIEAVRTGYRLFKKCAEGGLSAEGLVRMIQTKASHISEEESNADVRWMPGKEGKARPDPGSAKPGRNRIAGSWRKETGQGCLRVSKH